MAEREVDYETVSVIESLHRTALNRIGVLIDGNHLDEARQVADILTKVGVI